MNAIEHLKKLREESYPTVNFASEETTPFDVVASGLDNALLLHNAGSEAHAICALETIQSNLSDTTERGDALRTWFTSRGLAV